MPALAALTLPSPFKDEVDEEEHLDAALRQDEEGNTTRPAIIPRDDGVTSMFGKSDDEGRNTVGGVTPLT